jgi:hypothetical protein
LWEALVEAMGTAAPVTSSGRGAWNRAHRELREAGVTPEVVILAAREYRKAWPGITLTPNALAKHLHLFIGETPEQAATSKAQIVERWARESGWKIAEADRADVMPYRDSLTEEQRSWVLELCADLAAEQRTAA